MVIINRKITPHASLVNKTVYFAILIHFAISARKDITLFLKVPHNLLVNNAIHFANLVLVLLIMNANHVFKLKMLDIIDYII
jgi:hypothetical protein